RPDAGQHLAPLVICFRHEQVNRACAKVKPIEQYIQSDHDCHETIPYCAHLAPQSAACAAASSCSSGGRRSGPASISRQSKNNHRMASTEYMPMNPIRVNH